MNIFDSSNSIFRESGKYVFSKSFVPERILHRDNEINAVASGIGYILTGGSASDQIIYGKRGTGKTLIARYVTEQLIEKSNESGDKNNIKVFHVSLKNCRTEFAVAQAIQKKIGARSINGFGFSQGIHEIFRHIDNDVPEKYIIFILDEINEVKNPDILLHSLLRYNEIYGEMKKEIIYIFITNDSKFPYDLSPGTKSSFSSVKRRIFPPYNAVELRDILIERIQKGLNPGVCPESVISLCAAYAAQELGDAREAIKLLETAAEIAVERKTENIIDEYVTTARDQIRFESILAVIETLPVQLKAIAISCIRDNRACEKQNHKPHPSITGSVYEEYRKICKSIGLEFLSMRRFTDLIIELETIGFLQTQPSHNTTRNKGGNTKTITTTVPQQAESILLNDDHFIQLRPVPEQTTLCSTKFKN